MYSTHVQARQDRQSQIQQGNHAYARIPLASDFHVQAATLHNNNIAKQSCIIRIQQNGSAYYKFNLMIPLAAARYSLPQVRKGTEINIALQSCTLLIMH